MRREVADLIADARARKTRFDSLALRRARAAAVPALDLRRAIQGASFDYYLVLEALRDADRASWNTVDARTRLSIYVDELRHAGTYEDWGFPGLLCGEVGGVLVTFGPDAVGHLGLLLDDRSPALLSGSQEATLSRLHQNRVCDYALYFVTIIRGEPFTYPENPGERDCMIADLKMRLEE